MKRVFLGIFICLVIIMGVVTMVLKSHILNDSEQDKSVNVKVYKDKNKIDKMKNSVEKMAKKIKWEIKKDKFRTYIVGVFKNTSNEKIDYLQFDYKLKDNNGKVIEKSFTNETDINPWENREVKILCEANNFSSYEITVTESAI